MPLIVSQEAHEQLKAWLTEVAKIRAKILAWAIEEQAKGTFVATKVRKARVKDGSTVIEAPAVTNMMTGDHYAKALDEVRKGLAAKGFHSETTEWTSLEAHARSTLRILGRFIKDGRALILDHHAGLPGGISVKLAVGQNYYEQVKRHAAPFERWISMDRLGAMTTPPDLAFKANVENASYIEMGHVDRAWHARFIFVTMERTVPAEDASEDEETRAENKLAAKIEYNGGDDE